MKKPLLNTFAALMLCISVSAQTTVTITAIGAAGSFNTGSVNSAGVKNDGNMININQTTNAGWAKFDLTTLPAGAVVMSVNCAFTTYSTIASSAINNLYGFVGDPAVIAGATLYSNCNSGTTFNSSIWAANAINTHTLNTSGVSFIQTNIASPQLCIGYSRGSTNNYNIYGYPGTAGQQPMLVITYSVSTPCSGTPNAGTAVSSSTAVCSGGVVNLNLTGSTAASGLTYQWQSSPNGSTWTSIPTASTIATTQTVTAATYYKCIVACATNTAVSTSIFVNLTSPPVAGIITGPSTVNSGSVNLFSMTGATGNFQWYSGFSGTGPWSQIAGATSVSQTITAVGSGTVYYTAVLSKNDCPNDTADVPLQVTINFPGDNVCDAIPLTIGASTVQYGLLGATTQTGEVVPPGTGCSTNNSWCNNTLNNSRWFSFVAPASGYVTVQSHDFDTQLAIWKAATCSDLLSAATATLIAANDDDLDYTLNGGVIFSSFVKAACLTPGVTYFIQLDSYSAATSADITKVIITDMGTALNASFTGLAANYCTTDPSTTLTPVTTGGVFTLNTNTTSITQFDPATAGVGTHTVNYSIYGCSTNSLTTVSVCTGVKENLASSTITLFPNPNNGEVNISVNALLAGNSTLEIYDAVGKLVMTENLTKESNTINTFKLDAGIYMIKIINKNHEVTVAKMIKQ